jgi:hypothetical protein
MDLNLLRWFKKNGTLFFIKNAENGNEENQEIVHMYWMILLLARY